MPGFFCSVLRSCCACLTPMPPSSVALVGVSDLVVVAMDDAVLVASKDHAEVIKTLVNDMKGNGHDLVLQHTRVYRPLGLV